MSLPDFIKSALNGKIDYTQHFTERVASIGGQLSQILPSTVSHDSNMDYRAGQSLSIILDVEKSGLRGKVPIEIRIYISSKGPLFAIYCIDTRRKFVKPTEINHPVPYQNLPEFARRVIDVIRKELVSKGLKEVGQAYFERNAPGCVTELDLLPASVFESLFAEII